MLNEFDQAKKENQQYEDSFIPLIEKFNEFKNVMDSNFIVKSVKWLKPTIKPALSCSIDHKIKIGGHNYLMVKINNRLFLMSIGDYGDYKDKVYFVLSASDPIEHNVIYKNIEFNGWCGTIKYYNNKSIISLVQMFSYMLKDYKEYLHG